MKTSIEGKTVWITGAGSGIGRAAVNSLVQAGARVALSGRRVNPLEETLEMVQSINGNGIIVPVDVADSEAVLAAADEIRTELNQIDILINSAGINLPKRRYGEMKLGDWQRVIDANLNGAYNCIYAVLPEMRDRGAGLIINVSSWAGRHDSYVAGPAYGASKHAVSSMSATINLEEGRYGIRCCSLEPAEVATEILDRRPIPVPDEERARMLQPDDLGETIRFIAEMPAHVCLNEVLISPTWNRSHLGGSDWYPGPPS
ncbi:uncharacterized protein METZ01_LOCUS85578 [marine metagenome]|mgnify:CR=1 FL=1|jgi:NADP-dependent 3-hydroxy acid dehydrogenase YdfG|uniref:Oxidoreductase n=1 Tax=marine metagenome TaxID=408172 RepID=A0A381UXP4_9ZZZZ|tara:strand:+ start:665 stop:1441 length:777 start_codon:yes stop_codon:yes gene_type:complete